MALLSFSSLISASQFNNPYQGNVMVKSFDEAQLKEMALKQVLVKVSGNTDIGSLDETKLLLKKSQQLLSQFGYRSLQGTEYFSAVFDKRKINQSLKDMQQPIWGETRPTTLIWLVHNNKLLSDHLVKQANDASISWSLQQSETRRGISVQFPLMDLDDNLALTVSDVRGRFYDQVAVASSRYSRQHFVLAELQVMSNNKWRLNWQLIQTDKKAKQNRTLISERFVGGKSAVIKKMVDALADYYATQYAVFDNQGEKFIQTLRINGINSLAELSKLNSVLNNLLAISSFTVVAVEGELVTVDVKIKGGLNSFKNALIIQPNLQFETSLPVMTDKQAESIDITSESTESFETSAEVNPESGLLIDEDKVESVKADILYFNWR